MIAAIKSWMFDKALKQQHNLNGNTSYEGVNHCKTIFILSNGDFEPSKTATESYKSGLEKSGKKVDVLYFYEINGEVEDGYSSKDIKWNGVPYSESIEEIFAKKYDLLIYLLPEMENHHRYVSSLCSAKLKIGPAIKNENHLFDLIIDIQNVQDTRELIKNIDRQLQILSSD